MAQNVAAPSERVAAEYPVLSPEALGALRLAWRRAHENDDWTRNGTISDGWDRWTAYPYVAKLTYDLAFATRMLSKFSDSVPAWREVIAGTMDRLVWRFCQYAAIYDWVEQKGLDPNRSAYPAFYYKHFIPKGYAGVYNAPGYAGNGMATNWEGLASSLMVGPGFVRNRAPYFPQHSPAVGRVYNPDPVYGNGSSNIMYRGYFLETLGHCLKVTGDPKYEGPFEIVYDDDIRFTYTTEQIAQGLRDNWTAAVDENGSPMRPGIDCEVGKMFPACNAAGGLGLLLYDGIHGTDHLGAFMDWFEWAKKNVAGGPDPNGAFTWCAPYFDRDHGYMMDHPDQQFGLFFTVTALQMCPFERAFPERLYESAIRKFGHYDQETESLHLVLPSEATGPAVIDDVWATVAAHALAHEFGDIERRELLDRWMQNRYQPRHENGEFAFHFGLQEPWPRGIPNHFAALSFAGDAGSLAGTYRNVDRRRLTEPTMAGVDFPSVTVSQAFYDRDQHQLAVAIAPGSGDASRTPTTFRVTNLGSENPEVLCDGEPFSDWAATGQGEITIRTSVDEHSFVLRRV